MTPFGSDTAMPHLVVVEPGQSTAQPRESAAEHAGRQADVRGHLRALLGELLRGPSSSAWLVAAAMRSSSISRSLSFIASSEMRDREHLQPAVHLHRDVAGAGGRLGGDRSRPGPGTSESPPGSCPGCLRRLIIAPSSLNMVSDLVGVGRSGLGFVGGRSGGATGLKSSSTCQIWAPSASLAFWKSGRSHQLLLPVGRLNRGRVARPLRRAGCWPAHELEPARSWLPGHLAEGRPRFDGCCLRVAHASRA